MKIEPPPNSTIVRAPFSPPFPKIEDVHMRRHRGESKVDKVHTILRGTWGLKAFSRKKDYGDLCRDWNYFDVKARVAELKQRIRFAKQKRSFH